MSEFEEAIGADTRTPMSRALLAIADEHMAIGGVLHGVQFHAREVREKKMPPDFELFAAMLRYLDVFAEQYHHDKEDRYLFALLRARTVTAEALIAELEAQHAQGAALRRELAALLVRWRELPGERDAEGFFARLERYIDFQYRHMRKEETEVIPLARTLFTDLDWATVASAFEANEGPAGAPGGSSFPKLFSQILMGKSAKEEDVS